ncbi:MAG: patatin [bacterium]
MPLVKLALLAISVITVLSGAGQLIAPGVVLRIVGGEASPTSLHFFAIIGMFMVLFGGLMWQALRAPTPQPIPLFWAALQKLGAAAAVGIGVRHGLFSMIALLVASFDLFSGVLALWYWSRVRNS